MMLVRMEITLHAPPAVAVVVVGCIIVCINVWGISEIGVGLWNDMTHNLNQLSINTNYTLLRRILEDKYLPEGRG